MWIQNTLFLKPVCVSCLTLVRYASQSMVSSHSGWVLMWHSISFVLSVITTAMAEPAHGWKYHRQKPEICSQIFFTGGSFVQLQKVYMKILISVLCVIFSHFSYIYRFVRPCSYTYLSMRHSRTFRGLSLYPQMEKRTTKSFPEVKTLGDRNFQRYACRLTGYALSLSEITCLSMFENCKITLET